MLYEAQLIIRESRSPDRHNKEVSLSESETRCEEDQGSAAYALDDFEFVQAIDNTRLFHRPEYITCRCEKAVFRQQ